MDPVTAYQTLEFWDKYDFSSFLKPGITIPMTDNPQEYIIRLEGDLPGGVVMCGTTSELQVSLLNFYRAGLLAVEAKFDGDPLLVNFVRGRHGFGETKTMINIGPKRGWWGCTGSLENWKPPHWKNLRKRGELLLCPFNSLANDVPKAEKIFGEIISW